MACVFASRDVYWNLVVSCDAWRIRTEYCGVFSSLLFLFFVCVCVCVCVWKGWVGGGGAES